MILQSPFQALPILVVEKIIEYLEGRTRASFDDDIDKHNEKKRVLHPLLSISDVWRKAVLASICDNCKIIYIDEQWDIEVTYPACPAGFSYSPRHKNLVKRVVVTAPSWVTLYDIHSREVITWSQYKGPIFPSATTLVVELNKTKDRFYSMHMHYLTPPFTHKGIISFAHTLLRLTPAVTGVSVVFISTDATDIIRKGLCSILLSELCRGSAARLDFRSKCGEVSYPHKLTGVSELTSITQGDRVACTPIAQLAYHNASTLKELHIVSTSIYDWSALINCGDMAPTVYTHLVSLTMIIPENLNHMGWITTKDVVPFPMLSKLVISGKYPFDDDTLFRGNCGVLQKLSIPFEAIDRNALNRSEVLWCSAARQMDPIHTVLLTGEPRYMAPESSNRLQLDLILESSTTLKLNCDNFADNVIKALSTTPSTAILQHLIWSNRGCTVGDIISIVSALPSLVSLTCQISGPATRIGLIPENEHPSTLHEKYFPLSSSFRTLRISVVDYTDLGKVSIVAMQMAVMCPSLAQVYLPLELRKGFRGKVTWSSRNGPFKPYGDALRRLVK